MADRFTPPSMDWMSPGDLHKRFNFFEQKCNMIFKGPLKEVTEDEEKVNYMLLWAGDKALEIYNAHTFASEAESKKYKTVMDVLKAYVRPQSNQILSRYHLRCLKQGDLPLEEFVTQARLLIDDGGYRADIKEEMLRDTLVFGVQSDKVRRDAIAKGNELTFKQVYDLAKVDETTRAQMKVITKDNSSTELHSVRSRKKPAAFTKKPHQQQTEYSSQRQHASDVEANTAEVSSARLETQGAISVGFKDTMRKYA